MPETAPSTIKENHHARHVALAPIPQQPSFHRFRRGRRRFRRTRNGRHRQRTRRRKRRLEGEVRGAARQDNSKAAEELQQFKDSQLSEAEKTAKRIKELEAQNAAYAAERQQNEWRAQVSKETGVPASLLYGDSLEAMSANAKAIDQYAHPKPKGMPNQGKTPDGKAAAPTNAHGPTTCSPTSEHRQTI